jgi:hypothetical protein
MAASWFVRGGGKVYGPLEPAKLKQLVAEGKINEATEVAQNYGGPWYPAAKVKGLFAPAAAVPEAVPSNASPPRSVATPAPRTPPVTSPAGSTASPPGAFWQKVAAYYPQSTNGKIALIAGLCSLLSLTAGYFAGREHLRYQIRSSFEDAGKQFVRNLKEGFGQALGRPLPEPDEKPPEPKAKLVLGKPMDTDAASFVVNTARMEYPELKGGIRQTTMKHNEECLVVGLTIHNKDARKQLNVFYGQAYVSNVFTMQDDVGNRVDTMFFSSPDSDFAIVGSHPSYKDIDPEQSVEHFVGFKRPLPKTKSLQLRIDMRLIGQDGFVQYDIPINKVEGFTAN